MRTTDRLLAVIIALALGALVVYVAWVLWGDIPMSY
jgi:type II secretory pathway component PulJ